MNEHDYGREFKERLTEDIRRRASESTGRAPKVMLLGEPRWGLAWGLVIVATGVSLLLYQMQLIPFNPVARFWPLLLVLFGLMNLTTRSGAFFGILLILAGALLQLNKLGFTHLTLAELWPLALIGLGLLLIWGSLETRGFLRAKAKVLRDFRDQVTGAPSDTTTFNAVAIFGGCERRISGNTFHGGRATAVFGGIELDLRDADIESETILEVNCVFGGVEIRVPETWHVHSRNLPVFGGYDDKTRHPNVTLDQKAKTLIVTGMVVFGGVEIRN